MERLLRENWLVILVVALMVGAYVFLRTPGDNLGSAAEFDALVTDGTPTLINFYSNT